MTKRYYRYAEIHRKVKGVKQKRCIKCMKWKRQSVRQFCRDRYRKDGLRTYCKACDKAYGYEYRERHRSDVKEYLKFEQRHRVVKGVNQKLCVKCRKWKDERDYYKQKGTNDGLDTRCRDCRLKQSGRRSRRRNLRNEERNRIFHGVKQKLCCSCSKWKAQSDFSKDRTSKDGLGCRCKECQTKQARERYQQKNKGAKRYISHEDRHRIVKGVRQKLCGKCGQWKSESEYYRQRARRDGLSDWCKACSYEPSKKSHTKTLEAKR